MFYFYRITMLESSDGNSKLTVHVSYLLARGTPLASLYVLIVYRAVSSNSMCLSNRFIVNFLLRIPSYVLPLDPNFFYSKRPLHYIASLGNKFPILYAALYLIITLRAPPPLSSNPGTADFKFVT